MTDPLFSIIFLLIGAIGGIIIGILGTGSSLVILPTLSFIFPEIFPDSVAMRFAIGTCISTIMVGAISGSIAYIKKQQFNRRILRLTIPSVILGSLIAPQLSNYIPVFILQIYIALFLISVSVFKLLLQSKSTEKPLLHNDSYLVLGAFGCTLLSGLAGVALGILMIPMLSRYLNHLHAVGTSIILALIYAMIASTGYIFAGLNQSVALNMPASESLIPATLGYIYLPAFFLIVITISVFPFVGAKLASVLHPNVIEKIFYIFLLVAGASMLLRIV